MKIKRPFYLDENSMIRFPKREVYNNTTHELWFRDENIPTVGIVRGYFHNNHISVYINDYDIPPIHPAVIMDWFNTYNNLTYVELGAHKIGEEEVPKLVMFRGNTLKFTDEKKEEEVKEPKKDLVTESININSKNKIGYESNRDK